MRIVYYRLLSIDYIVIFYRTKKLKSVRYTDWRKDMEKIEIGSICVCQSCINELQIFCPIHISIFWRFFHKLKRFDLFYSIPISNRLGRIVKCTNRFDFANFTVFIAYLTFKFIFRNEMSSTRVLFRCGIARFFWL